MIKTRKTIRRSLSFIISLFMILTLLTPIAYAADPSVGDFDHNAEQGDTTGGEYVGGGYGWGPAKQGYRVTLLSGNQLFPSLGANAVKDILYSSKPSSGIDPATNRLGHVRSTIIPDTIGSGVLSSIAGMPPSLTSDMAANGIAVRNYLLNGAGGGGGQGNPGGGGSSGPTINWTNTSGGGGGGSTTGNNSGSISADERNDAQQVINTWKNRLVL